MTGLIFLFVVVICLAPRRFMVSLFRGLAFKVIAYRKKLQAIGCALLVMTPCLLPMPVYANWLGTVFDVIQEVRGVAATPTEKPLSYLKDAAKADSMLPAHWQQYWLDESTFNSRIFLAATGQQNAPVVLLVHGLGQNGLRDWLAIVPALEKKYRVVMVDLPGFGLSLPPKAKLSPTNYAKVLHAVKNQFSAVPIAVVGHSMGGAVTLRYSADFPQDVSQLALIDAAGILQRTAFVKHSAVDRLAMNDDKETPSLLSYAAGFQNIGGSLVEKLALLPDPTVWLGKSELAWGTALGSYPNMNAALSLVEEDFSRAIFYMDKPIAILWGGKDAVAPLRTGEMLSHIIPQSSFKIIADAGHNPMPSHSQIVGDWLLHYIAVNTVAATTAGVITREVYTDVIAVNQGEFSCKKQNNINLTGRYTRITLNDCKEVELTNVEVNELIAYDSSVDMNNSVIGSAAFNKSTVVATAGKFIQPLHLSESRVDIAGVYFDSLKPFVVEKESRIIVSVSKTAAERFIHTDVKSAHTVW